MSVVQMYILFVYAGLIIGLESVPITLDNTSSSVSDLILSSGVQPSIQTRRSDYTYTPGVGAHKVHSRMTTWNTARRSCDEEGAFLAIINSAAEAEAVTQLMNNTNTGEVYIGLHDLYEEDEFVTIHGDPLARTGFDVWHDGEPNNLGDNENCVIILISGKLNDVPCNTRFRYICELPYDQSDVTQSLQDVKETVQTNSQISPK